MKLIAGLGNPGREYADTRHNFGFQAADAFLEFCRERYRAENLNGSWRSSGGYELAEVSVAGNRVKLIKPLRYMNRSGEAVGEIMRFHKIPAAELLVIHDELDLPFGTLKLKSGGGDGGNNGLRSITECLGSGDYLRLRLGIGKPPQGMMDGSSWVLSRFSPEEKEFLPRIIEKACAAVEEVIVKGFKAAQNKFNTNSDEVSNGNQKV